MPYPPFSISEVTTFTATFEEDLAAYRAAGVPIAGMTTQCHGWFAASVSFGRTSQPQASVQIAATSLLLSQ